MDTLCFFDRLFDRGTGGWSHFRYYYFHRHCDRGPRRALRAEFPTDDRPHNGVIVASVIRSAHFVWEAFHG
jgi:hypothetical protein